LGPCFCAKALGFYSITQTQVISKRQLGLV
jgi:hypothetical protein